MPEVSGKWISPIQAKEMAEAVMLHGRKAESEYDWELIVNCWAINFPLKLADVETRVVAKIMECPLSDESIRNIIDFQMKNRTT